ncbi:hypothetical protein LWI29_038049 [Acer saccharum]|uniref:Uncharacterized protein n=1 Tax=Acer saccharum TaxID=4024 RepID=A0AA39TA20_ACESA|nr:hypothetical protein LWI29_038049 [Acer saccharum]
MGVVDWVLGMFDSRILMIRAWMVADVVTVGGGDPPQHFIHTDGSHLVAVFAAVNAASRFVDVRRRRVTAAAYHFVAVAPLFSLRRCRRVTAAAASRFVAAAASHFFVAAGASHYLISSREGDGWENSDCNSFQY